MTTDSSGYFDVIIIGGGPAGTAAAIKFLEKGFRTAIIERSSYDLRRIGETLPPSIRNPLTKLGLWKSFLADDHIESFAILSAWGTPEAYERQHIFDPYGTGWHVDRARFDRMLVRAANKLGATIYTQSRITHVARIETRGWIIAIQKYNRTYFLEGTFLIDATGRSSALYSNIPRSFQVADHLIGIVKFISQVAEPYTLVESVSSGWWYSAPLPNDQLVVVHMTDADLLAASPDGPDAYWHRQLVQAPLTCTRIGLDTPLTPCKIISAASLIRRPTFGTDWLAAGDASIAFDPLSGQGVYNALTGGMLAAETIIAHFDGNNHSFIDYSDWIKNEFSNYMDKRSEFYKKEQRWYQHPFWRRRQVRRT
jgi:flavin-dependent dehydrogenase